MKHEPPPIRTHDPDEVPVTVIHHYEQDQTLLARWLQGLLAKGAGFWFIALGTSAVILVCGYLISNLMTNPSTNGRAWTEVMLAGSTEDYQKVAETESDTSAGRWSALRAATQRYGDALSKLPGDRESAAPLLTQALEGYQAIEGDAKADPMLKRLAILGTARTLETQDKLSEAITAYEKIATIWPNTDDGKAAVKRVERLKSPNVVAFYKKFATYKPALGSTTLPPRGTNRLDFPIGHPPLDGPIVDAPPLNGVPIGKIKTGELPTDPFQKTAAEKKAESDDSGLPSVFPKDSPKAPSPPK